MSFQVGAPIKCYGFPPDALRDSDTSHTCLIFNLPSKTYFGRYTTWDRFARTLGGSMSGEGRSRWTQDGMVSKQFRPFWLRKQ